MVVSAKQQARYQFLLLMGLFGAGLLDAIYFLVFTFDR
jgi:hypothetical protein